MRASIPQSKGRLTPPRERRNLDDKEVESDWSLVSREHLEERRSSPASWFILKRAEVEEEKESGELDGWSPSPRALSPSHRVLVIDVKLARQLTRYIKSLVRMASQALDSTVVD